jgi:hypothetical protein
MLVSKTFCDSMAGGVGRNINGGEGKVISNEDESLFNP